MPPLFLIPFLLLLSFTSTENQQLSTAKTPVQEISAQWARLWSEKQLEQVTDLYAEDAVFLTATGTRTTGKAAIRELFRMALAANPSSLSVKSIKAENSGTLAYDSGEYREIIGADAQGTKREGEGNYLVVLRRDKEDRWLIVHHMWTDKR
jgi:uncharacterized protein (TIGR02246 family)